MFEYECISKETNQKCIYTVFSFLNEEKNINRITEISEILSEVCNLDHQKPHFQKYLDYLIKTSQTRVRIETVRELNVTRLHHLSTFGLAIFFYNLRTHLRDLVTALSYLKSRFIGDPRWLKLRNVGFSLDRDQIQLLDFVFIGRNYEFRISPGQSDYLSNKSIEFMKSKGND